MTAIDWAIALFTFGLALWGFRQGLIVGAMGLGGLVVGAALGSRLAPVILESGSNSPYAPMFALLGAVLVGSLSLTVAVSVGASIRGAAVRGPFGEVVDGIGGALLMAALAMGIVWVLGAVAVYAPGADSLRRDVQRSMLLAGINDLMPPSGPLIKALYRIQPLPQIATSPGRIEAPDAGAGGTSAVRRASSSVVRVSGSACGVGIMGSGWVIAPGVVITNAHVVAGQTDTIVEANDGQSAEAAAIAFRPRNDIAVLAAPVDLPALPVLSTAAEGTSAAVIGYPNDGPLTITPARAGETRRVFGEDAYGSGPFEREMLALRGDVRRGNSGGPMVDSAGRVLGTVFASTTEGPPGGLAIPNDVVRRIVASSDGREVETGPCAR